MHEQQIDILIVGGGLTGATLMLALADSGYSTMLVETHAYSERSKADFDARTLALSPSTARILTQLKLWPLLEKSVTPIEMIHVSQQSCFGQARLRAKVENPLGYVVEMHEINRALHQLLPMESIKAPAHLIALDDTHHLATIECNGKNELWRAKLIIAADGLNSSVRQLSEMSVNVKEYSQQALVANIGLTRFHGNVAYERFTAFGPMALLPMSQHRSSLVWALPPDEATRLQALGDPMFLKALQQAFGYKLGRFVKVGKRHIYPLRQAIMPQQTAWPLVFVGNAAHNLHPVAGQGFNLGLRDVAALAQCIIQYGLKPSMLEHYQSMRRYDQAVISGFTDGLVEVFTSRFPGVKLARSMGLIAMDNLSFLQKILTRHAGGFSGVLPDLVCGIALTPKEQA